MEQDNMASTAIERVVTDTLDVVSLSRSCCKKYYITARPDSPDKPCSAFKNLAGFLGDHDARIISQLVFGDCAFHGKGTEMMKKALGPLQWPVTWLWGDACSGGDLNATQVYAISGTSFEFIRLDGKIVGTTFEDDEAQYCLLGDIGPKDLSLSREDQARQTFERIESTLATAGMDFSNVVRTWIYLKDLLDWYDEFNAVRNQFFRERGVFDGVVPASTGIGAANPAGAAIITGAYAVKAKNGANIRIEAVPSPLQCPAIDYKSSFSRAVEVALSDHRRIYISGTASIHPGGKSAHIDDVPKQIALTMEVAQAILESRDMGWQDTNRAIAYFKDMASVPVLEDYCKSKNLPYIPFAYSHADICRDDLLFEIEVDAIKAD